MPLFNVRRCPKGKFDTLGQLVDALTSKEAAEKVHGGSLSRNGRLDYLRIQVRSQTTSRPPELFYEL
jgi:hypothetical protein